jgi:hypothetical protein
MDQRNDAQPNDKTTHEVEVTYLDAFDQPTGWFKHEFDEPLDADEFDDFIHDNSRPVRTKKFIVTRTERN